MVCTSTFRSLLWFQRTELDEEKQRKNQEYENSRIPYGIWLSSCSNSNVSGNNITGSGYGIYLGSSSNISINGNNITLSSGHGIYLDSSDFNSVSWNNIAASNGHGIFLDSNSDYNSVGRNNVTASNGYGVARATTTLLITQFKPTFVRRRLTFGMTSIARAAVTIGAIMLALMRKAGPIKMSQAAMA